MKKFFAAIGNPPYQSEVKNKGDRPNPVYDQFLDAAFTVAERVEMIHPARFLFGAGQTPKEWNEKMLNDPHYKVLTYEPDASKIFSNTDIKGGIAITYRSDMDDFGAISVFTPYEELNSIIQKIKNINKDGYLDSVVSPRGMYRLSKEFYEDHPEATTKVGKGSGNMIVSNIFDVLPDVFLQKKPSRDNSYLRVLGRTNNTRVYRYIQNKYVICNEYIGKYKIFFPEANSSGQFGEVLTLPDIGEPNDGATDTFINIGLFDERIQAESLIKYIKTKFLRALLGAKKSTHHSGKAVWTAIPLQDFTPASDIVWSHSVAEIDQQLYKKYTLSNTEIEFIETHVKEMN